MNGQLALVNQLVASKDTKGPSILKGTGCVRGVTALTTASLPGLVTGCEAISKAVVLLQWQVPNGLKVIYVKGNGS